MDDGAVSVCLVSTCICQYVEPCLLRENLRYVCVVVLMTFDMLYLDNPVNGVLDLPGFIEDILVSEKALLD